MSAAASPLPPTVLNVRPYQHGNHSAGPGDPPTPEHSSNDTDLQRRIGSAWAIPHDGRFPIEFTTAGRDMYQDLQHSTWIQSIKAIVDSGATFEVQDMVFNSNVCPTSNRPHWDRIERYKLSDPRFGSEQSEIEGPHCSYNSSVRASVVQQTIEKIIKPFVARGGLGDHKGRTHDPFAYISEPEEDRNFDIAPWRRKM